MVITELVQLLRLFFCPLRTGLRRSKSGGLFLSPGMESAYFSRRDALASPLVPKKAGFRGYNLTVSGQKPVWSPDRIF